MSGVENFSLGRGFEGRLRGRVALVTGASRGIGRATALRLAREGAAVAVNYRRGREAAEETVRAILKAGGRALATQADVADADSVTRMVRDVAHGLGPVDILVNNAGLLHPGDLAGFDEDEFDAMWRVNVKGVIYCTRDVVPLMRPTGKGAIVNISSLAALGTSFPGTTFYALTKAAVLTLSRRLALELGPDGIRVNAVCPGFIGTDMVFSGRTEEEIQGAGEAAASRSMLRRIGKPDEVADAISFLVSEDARFVTGQILTVDGGRLDFLSRS